MQRNLLIIMVLWLIGAGCQQPLHKRQAEMPPDPGETLPAWAFDAPYYFRPPPDAVPAKASKPDRDLPDHYFVRKPVFLVERPDNQVALDRVPRIAVWWTNTNGCEWTRAGYFGLGQTHFPFVAGDDGDYGVRFVGPGIKESLTEETIPHRIYHFDSQAPRIKVTVEPQHPIYEPNEVIWIHWCAEDQHLDPKCVRLAVCWSWENPDLLEYRESEIYPMDSPEEQAKGASRFWKPFKPEFNNQGVLAYTIPEYAAGEAFQIQVRAKDKAGNYGAGYSKVIFVEGYKGGKEFFKENCPDKDFCPGESPATQPAGEDENLAAGSQTQDSSVAMNNATSSQMLPVRREKASP
jgi:hypothetical protein